MRALRKLLCFLLAIVTAFTLLPTVYAAHPFRDVSKGAWYASYVAYCFDNGLMSGMNTHTFGPDVAMDRAMLVTVMNRIENEAVSSGSVPFVDVSAGDYFYQAVRWAYARKIVTGTSATTFSPRDSVTREQMVTIFFRYANHKKLPTTARADLRSYTDSSTISDYAVEAFQWAVSIGLINGVSENQLAPKATTTRAQCATILQRFTQWVNPSQVAGGSYGNSMSWTLYSNGTLKIGGTGAIYDYAKGENSQPWSKYRKSITALVVEDGITRIGDRAFQSCSSMKSAHIGRNVASIGEWAFQNCYALTDVTLPPSVQLETGAFRSTPVEWEVSAAGSTLYVNSRYHHALSQLVLTGDYREDIIYIALSQIGYHEGDSEADYAGGNTNGSKNYTEYGRRLDSIGTEWCSEFASWCIRMAGVPTQTVASSRSANVTNFTKNTSAAWYTWEQTIYGGGSYTPRKGDILLWAWDTYSHNTGENLSHTSILAKTEARGNDTVLLTTIDGNSNDQVAKCYYEVNRATGALIGRTGRLCYIIAPDYEGST